MGKKIIVKKIDTDNYTIEAEFFNGGTSITNIYPLPEYSNRGGNTINAADIKMYLMQSFPYFEIPQSETEPQEKIKLDDDIHSLVGSEFSEEELDREKIQQSNREDYVSTMYGSKYNVMSIKHIIMETLQELGVIK